MYFKGKKIGAFTLIELIVAMSIGSLVVIFAINVYDIIKKQFENYNNSNNITNDIFLVYDIMHDDFDKADKIVYKYDDLEIVLENGDQCKYSFEEDYIIRSFNNLQDTFNVKSENIKAYYDSKNAIEIVDEFSFETEVFENTINISFYKKYASDILMQNDK